MHNLVIVKLRVEVSYVNMYYVAFQDITNVVQGNKILETSFLVL